MYFYHLYDLGTKGQSSTNAAKSLKVIDPAHDYFKIEEAIYELTKLERKLIAFWFYPSRGLSYQEALILHQGDSMNHPEFRPKSRLQTNDSVLAGMLV